jgi:oligo-1,6-glucosidase
MPDDYRQCLFDTQKKVADIGFLSNIIENHDEPRGVSRYLPPHARNEAGKKMLAAAWIFLRGIPFIYQGQELGMSNCARREIGEYDDLSTHDQYQKALDAGCTEAEALECCQAYSRDNGRTPMHWTDGENAGFTTGTPWLALNPNYVEINAAEQDKREDSVLNFYRRLTRLRKAYRDTFTYGRFLPAYESQEGIFAYIRENETTGERILVAANFGQDAAELSLTGGGEVLETNLDGAERIGKALRGGSLPLRSCECAVIRL